MKKIILLFLLISGGLFAQTPALNLASTSFKKAEAAFTAGETKKALVYYKDATMNYMKSLSANPDLIPEDIKKRISYCRNQIDIIRGQLDSSATVMKNASQEKRESALNESDDMESIIRQTKAALSVEELSNAKALAIKGIQLDPTNQEIRFLAAVIQCKAGKYNDALAILKQLASENTDSSNIQVALGVTYMAKNELDEAETALRKAVQLDSKNAEAYINMAQLLLLKDPPSLPLAWANYNKAMELGSQRIPTLEARLTGRTVKYATVKEASTEE